MERNLQKKMMIDLFTYRQLERIFLHYKIEFIGIYLSKKIKYEVLNETNLLIGIPISVKAEIEQYLAEKNKNKGYKIEYQDEKQSLIKKVKQKKIQKSADKEDEKKDDKEDGTGGSKGKMGNQNKKEDTINIVHKIGGLDKKQIEPKAGKCSTDCKKGKYKK